MNEDPLELLTDKNSGIGTVRFNRPAKHNAITFDMWCNMGDAIDAFETDDDVRVIVVTGEGGRAYVDDTKFKKNNLKNYFTNFKHPIYKQLSEPFIPKMSTIDLLLNYDLKTSKKIIKGSGIIGE